jgi:hypothetical protein
MCPVDLGLKTPPVSNIIWRYMTLSKFEKFVQSGALWFAAANSFPDAFEGTKAATEVRVRDGLWNEVGVPEEQREIIRGFTDWTRQFSFVNCWMMNTNESDLMWNCYAERHGVAIESTYGKLRSVLPDWIYIYEVEYIDYENDRMIGGHSLAPVFYKRKEFAGERELRAVIDVFPVGDPRRLVTKPLPTGHLVEVDLCRLITRVILSPSPTPGLLKRFRELTDSVGIPLTFIARQGASMVRRRSRSTSTRMPPTHLRPLSIAIARVVASALNIIHLDSRIALRAAFTRAAI